MSTPSTENKKAVSTDANTRMLRLGRLLSSGGSAHGYHTINAMHFEIQVVIEWCVWSGKAHFVFYNLQIRRVDVSRDALCVQRIEQGLDIRKVFFFVLFAENDDLHEKEVSDFRISGNGYKII